MLSLQPHPCQLLVQWFLLIYLHCSYHELLWVCNAISSPSITLQNLTDGDRAHQSFPSEEDNHLQQLIYGVREDVQPAAPPGAATCAARTGILPLAASAAATQAQTPVPAASTALTDGEALPRGISRSPHGDLSFSKQPGLHKHDAVSNQVKASPLQHQNLNYRAQQ